MKCCQCWFDSCHFSVNDTHDGNVSVILKLIRNGNTTLYAECPPSVTITPSAVPPYSDGDVLTCSAVGNDPTYVWSGTNGGISYSDDTSDTVTLLKGEFCLICTATVNSDTDCSACASLCDSARGKCTKQYDYLLTILMLVTLSDGPVDYYDCLRYLF